VRVEKNKDVIVTFGPIINDVIRDIPHVDVVNALYQKPILDSNVKDLLSYERIIIYNPYATKDGFVNNFIKKLALYNYRGQILVVAIEQEFVKAMSIKEQMNECHVAIADVIKIMSQK